MSNVIRGKVAVVSVRGKAVNIQVEGQGWYGCGFTTPDKLKFKQGDTISFSFTENGNFKNVDMKTVEVEAGAAIKAPAAQSSSRTDWAAKDKADAERQRSISIQACRNSAIEATKILKELDALPLGSKKPDIAGNLLAFIDDLTMRWYEETQAVAAGQNKPAVVSEETFD